MLKSIGLNLGFGAEVASGVLRAASIVCKVMQRVFATRYPLLAASILCLTAVLCGAADKPNPFGGIYDFDSFDAVQAPKEHVILKAAFNGKHLVVEASVAKNWHLYSVTQPDGGTIRTTFQIRQETGDRRPEENGLPPDTSRLIPQEIRPSLEPHVNKNMPGFDVDIEEHQDSVSWLLTFQDELPKDVAIKGTLDGQVCQSGEGGLCIPITVPFEAKYDGTLKTEPAKIAERFVWQAAGDRRPEDTAASRLTPQEVGGVTSLSSALFYGFLGGIILNFMPCVLPVIGLKILSFFEQAGHNRSRALLLNVAYSLGLLSVFLVLAFFSLGLSILFTFDVFNVLMACIVFAMALSLMDIWELSVPAFLGRGKSAQMMQREGIFGAFYKGIITTLLAIPCGAPLLSPAINWSDLQIRNGNSIAVFVMYGVIGLGMASPYLIAGAFPQCLRFLPKPGNWMTTFRNVLGFCLLGAVIWILYFVQLEKLLPSVALLFAIWFVCWLVGRNQMTGGVKAADYVIGLAVLAAVLVFSFELPYIQNRYTLESAMTMRLHGKTGTHWQMYSKAEFEKALAAGKTVIVDFTADWCVNCKVLEATVLESADVLQALDTRGIVSLTADCTRSGEATDLLLQLGPRQVPVLAIFNPKQPDKPTVLRGGYTAKTVVDMLESVGN